MKKKYLIPLLFVGLWACEKDLDSGSGGGTSNTKRSSYDYCVAEGGFSLFLEAVEMTGNMDLLKGKGMSTLFAPTDAAVQNYLSANNHSSLNDVNIDTLSGMVAFHFMKYGFSKEDLLTFSPDGVTTEKTPGMFYKHQTYMQRGRQTVYDKVNGRELEVFNEVKLMPILTDNVFSVNNVRDYASNYNFFYPDIEYVSGEDRCYGPGFSISKYAVPTDNGYVYHADHFIEPLKTIQEEIDASDRFSITRDLYSYFTDITYDNGVTKDYGKGDSLFNYTHLFNTYARLPHIAYEWMTPSDVYQENARYSFALMAPTDAAWTTFMQSYFGGKTLEEIPSVSKYFLAENHARRMDGLLLPEMLKMGLSTTWGGLYDLDPYTEVKYRSMCSNGTFYEIEKVLAPLFFESSLAPIFKLDNYTTMQYMLFLGESGNSYMGIEPSTSLVVNDEEAFNQGIEVNEAVKFGTESVNINTKKQTQQDLQNILDYSTIVSDVDILSYTSPNPTLLETRKENSFLELYYDAEIGRQVLLSESGNQVYINKELENTYGHTTYEVDILPLQEGRGIYQKGSTDNIWPSHDNILYNMQHNTKPDIIVGNDIQAFALEKGLAFLLIDSLVDSKTIEYVVPVPNKASIDADGTPELRSNFWSSYLVAQEENEHFDIRKILLGEMATPEIFQTENPSVQLQLESISGTKDLKIRVLNGMDYIPGVNKPLTAVYLGVSKEAIVYGIGDGVIYPGQEDFDKLYINKQ